MSDQVKPISVVEVIQPKVTIERSECGGDLRVKLDGNPIVTIHYIYGWIDNATQHSLAKQIATMWEAAPAPPIVDDAALVNDMVSATINVPAGPDRLSRCMRAALAAARPAIERAARAKALDEAAGVCDAFADNQDKTVKALVVRRAILALKDRT